MDMLQKSLSTRNEWHNEIHLHDSMTYLYVESVSIVYKREFFPRVENHFFSKNHLDLFITLFSTQDIL